MRGHYYNHRLFAVSGVCTVHTCDLCRISNFITGGVQVIPSYSGVTSVVARLTAV